MRFLKRTAHNAAAQDKFGAKLIIPKLKQLLLSLQRIRFIERTEEIADFGKHEPR